MKEQCKTCRKWQGNALREWGDCYTVIGYFHPPLLTVAMNTEGGKTTLSTPFDPHDAKYWKFVSGFATEYSAAIRSIIENGGSMVKIKFNRERDLVFDQFNGERVGNVTLPYIQTHQDYNCPEWEGEK